MTNFYSPIFTLEDGTGWNSVGNRLLIYITSLCQVPNETCVSSLLLDCCFFLTFLYSKGMQSCFISCIVFFYRNFISSSFRMSPLLLLPTTSSNNFLLSYSREMQMLATLSVSCQFFCNCCNICFWVLNEHFFWSPSISCSCFGPFSLLFQSEHL